VSSYVTKNRVRLPWREYDHSCLRAESDKKALRTVYSSLFPVLDSRRRHEGGLIPRSGPSALLRPLFMRPLPLIHGLLGQQ